MSRQSLFMRMFLAASVSSAAGLDSAALVPAAEDAKTHSVKAGEINLTVPVSWQQKAATNNFRLAQFDIPKVGGDPEDGEFVVFSFGGGGGGVDANIQRWIGQFQSKDRKMKLTSGKCPHGEYVLVDISGTWMKPVGRMIDQRTVEMPNARVLGVILKVKDAGNYFLRLTGPKKTTSANADAFRAAIGADAKSEKEYKLAEE